MRAEADDNAVVGLFKKLFGRTSDAPSADADTAGKARTDAPARERPPVRGRRGARPELPEERPAPSQTIEDALAARDAGDRVGARKILQEIDRGGGLRTVLRAAAALEAGDGREVTELVPTIANDEPRWRLVLQLAAAFGDSDRAARYIEQARAAGAPAWAIGWTRALSADETERRQGLVELLFADPALARTVAARDLEIVGAQADATATQRYAAFAHGRDCIRRFGADVVASVVDRASGAR